MRPLTSTTVAPAAIEIGADGIDLAVAHANVEHAILAAGGIDQAAAL